jgi:hypothetical protein
MAPTTGKVRTDAELCGKDEQVRPCKEGQDGLLQREFVARSLDEQRTDSEYAARSFHIAGYVLDLESM